MLRVLNLCACFNEWFNIYEYAEIKVDTFSLQTFLFKELAREIVFHPARHLCFIIWIFAFLANLYLVNKSLHNLFYLKIGFFK